MRKIGAGVCAFIVFLACTAVAAGADRPAWCQKGWECLPTEELAEATLQTIRLEADYERLKAKQKRFGLTVGLGAGAGAVLQQDWSVAYVPTGGVFVVWGWRF